MRSLRALLLSRQAKHFIIAVVVVGWRSAISLQHRRALTSRSQTTVYAPTLISPARERPPVESRRLNALVSNRAADACGAQTGVRLRNQRRFVIPAIIIKRCDSE